MLGMSMVGFRDTQGRFASASDHSLVAFVAAEGELLRTDLEHIYRTLAPHGSGERTRAPFAASIEAGLTRTSAGFALEVGTDQGELRSWITDGTKAHPITPVDKLALAFTSARYGDLVLASVQHPGTRPNPWEDDAQAAALRLLEERGAPLCARMERVLTRGV